MRVVHSIHDIPGRTDVYLTIGNFDGVHRGHQKIIRRLVSAARRGKALSCVMTFMTHPRKIIFHRDAVDLLQTNAYKLTLLEQAGVDVCCVLPFNERIRQLSYDAFLRHVVPAVRVKKVIVGYDFHFGKGRAGTVATFRSYCRQQGIRFEKITGLCVRRDFVSSNRVRELVRTGNLADAARCLGRPYAVVGTVVKGTETGKKIGFPTANVTLGTEVVPPDGVYSVRLRRLRMTRDGYYARTGKKTYAGLAYKGPQPAFIKQKMRHPVIEVYVLGFKGNLYDTVLEVSFDAYMRKPQRVRTLDELHALIEKDVKKHIKNKKQ